MEKERITPIELLRLEAGLQPTRQPFSTAEIYRIILEKFRETRIIRIKGKNVDNLDLEKVQNLILQANEKASKVNLRNLFKGLKRSRPNNSQAK